MSADSGSIVGKASCMANCKKKFQDWHGCFIGVIDVTRKMHTEG